MTEQPSSLRDRLQQENINKIVKDWQQQKEKLNDTSIILLCPTCQKEVKPNGKPDDAGTQFYICKNGHQTGNPTKKEISWEQEFTLKLFKNYEKNKDEIDTAQAEKLKKEKEDQKRFEKSVQTIEKELGPITYVYIVNEDHPFNPNELAETILSQPELGIITDKCTNTLYFYTNNSPVYHQDGEKYLKNYLVKVLGKEARTHRIKEVVELIRTKTYANIQPSKKIAFENGIFDLETKKLAPFTKYEFITNQLNVAYNPDVPKEKYENWLNFINESCPDDKDLLQEWSGYCLVKGMPFHVLMWLYGPSGRNGKGVWQRTMKGILGNDNVSNVQIHELQGNNRFAAYNLKDTLLNLSAEPRTDKMLSIEMLQSLTGKDTIDAEKKGIQDRFKLESYTKITVIGNSFPTINKPTDAFWERLLLCTFPNRFVGNKQKQDLEEIWLNDPEQRSAILNWMLEGAYRLLANHGFTLTKSQEEMIIQFKRISDSVGAFLSECVEFKKDAFTPIAQASDAYKGYCDSVEIPEAKRATSTEFNSKLRNHSKIKETSKRIGIEKKKTKGWLGFEVKPFLEELEEETEVDSKQKILATGTTGTKGTPILSGKNLESEKNDEDLSENMVPKVPTVPSLTAKDCLNWHKPSCSHPNPDCLNPINPCPKTCRTFKPSTLEETSTEDLSFDGKCELKGEDF